MLRYIFSLSLIFLVVGLQAQQTNDTTVVEETKDYAPSMIILGYNTVPLVNTLFFSGKAAQNGQVGLDLANYLLMLDFGIQSTERKGETYTYQNDGTFYRIGIEANVLKTASDANGLMLGLRYARSRFSDQMKISDDFGFGPVEIESVNEVVKSRWWELTLGLNVKIYKQIYFGYLVRYKLYKVNKGVNSLVPYDLPGFGKNENKTTVGFDYYIRWILPFGKEAPPAEE